jgi:hypothetical protein
MTSTRSINCLRVIGVLILVYAVAQASVFDKGYTSLLKKQGFSPLKSPRSNFGVGSVIPIDGKKNIFIAGPDECFPGLDAEIQSGQTTLISSKQVRGLNISASGSYSPTGAAEFLSKIAAALGYKSSATMDVSFGETTALNLTAVGLQNYLLNHKVSKVCAQRLKDPKNAVIFSMARVNSLTYTFNGSKDINASVNASALQSAISAAGSMEYTNSTNNSLTITTPLYVGYNAFSLKDLAIADEESSADVSKILQVRVVNSRAEFPQ